MNKQRIDKMIPDAFDKLDVIADKDKKIDKTYRSGVSSFGAAVAMGSLESAAAFFSAEKTGATYDRKKLGMIIAEVALNGSDSSCKSLYAYVKKHRNDKDCKEKILDAAVAVKLAMNLYELK